MQCLGARFDMQRRPLQPRLFGPPFCGWQVAHNRLVEVLVFAEELELARLDASQESARDHHLSLAIFMRRLDPLVARLVVRLPLIGCPHEVPLREVSYITRRLAFHCGVGQATTIRGDSMLPAHRQVNPVACGGNLPHRAAHEHVRDGQWQRLGLQRMVRLACILSSGAARTLFTPISKASRTVFPIAMAA